VLRKSCNQLWILRRIPRVFKDEWTISNLKKDI
jgi:hypothetical protein